ncbi:hypothetical protein [Streptomyces fulvorobeus]|uniref:Uncharacterized protein n=1 Tax=Streptomyces fulvorobeus TaxID=284028 RepID=A0A7Y9KX12_9ACTN|nr:hypothetical protein [Streptomyces fulvorobeus]NYE40438.1 hypothetical protein [Streptomyces fulvorobeus]
MSNHKDAEPYLRRAHSTQVTGFTWEFTGRSLTVRGNCPRCEGETDYQPPTDVQVGATKGPGPPAKPGRVGPEEMYMVCRCAYPHPHDALGKGGCGLSWIAVRPPAGP